MRFFTQKPEAVKKNIKIYESSPFVCCCHKPLERVLAQKDL